MGGYMISGCSIHSLGGGKHAPYILLSRCFGYAAVCCVTTKLRLQLHVFINGTRRDLSYSVRPQNIKAWDVAVFGETGVYVQL